MLDVTNKNFWSVHAVWDWLNTLYMLTDKKEYTTAVAFAPLPQMHPS